MPPTILITRPAPGGARLAAALRDLGTDDPSNSDLPIILSPALAIEAAGDAPDLMGVRHLIFTSQQGVWHFARLSDRRDIPAYAVGDATAEAAREIGLTAVSCGGDARDVLAQILADKAEGPMLHLRGSHAATDLAADLRAAGLAARSAVIYAQRPLALNAEARACLDGAAPVIAPVFSPRSAAALFAAGLPRAPVIVLAISDAAARAVPEGAAAQVIVADRPDMQGVLRAWPCALSAAYRLEGTKSAQ